MTVTDAVSGEFLYKVRPGSHAAVAFGTVRGPALEARVDDERIVIRGRMGEEVVDMIQGHELQLRRRRRQRPRRPRRRGSAGERPSRRSCWACSSRAEAAPSRR